MKSSFIFLSLLFAITRLASAAADGLTTARAEIAPLHAEMQAAANAHDTDRHLSFYVREPSLIFILNDQLIAGWDALREKQRQWWNDGKTDVVYTAVGEPEYQNASSRPCDGDLLPDLAPHSTRRSDTQYGFRDFESLAKTPGRLADHPRSRINCGKVSPAFALSPSRPSNQAMERTADRCASTFEMTSTRSQRATRGLVRRRSSCSR